jgi:hypothetical protein
MIYVLRGEVGRSNSKRSVGIAERRDAESLDATGVLRKGGRAVSPAFVERKERRPCETHSGTGSVKPSSDVGTLLDGCRRKEGMAAWVKLEEEDRTKARNRNALICSTTAWAFAKASFQLPPLAIGVVWLEGTSGAVWGSATSPDCCCRAKRVGPAVAEEERRDAVATTRRGEKIILSGQRRVLVERRDEERSALFLFGAARTGPKDGRCNSRSPLKKAS